MTRGVPLHCRTLLIGLAITALATSLGAQSGRLVQPDRDPALAGAVTDFLNQWLIKRNPASAIQAHLSSTMNDERLLPAGAFSLAEYQERFGGERALQFRAMRQSDAQSRMTTYLQSQMPPPDVTFAQVTQAFMPFSIDDLKRLDPELWNIVGARGARVLPGLPAIAYAVRSWGDLSWTNTGALGLRLVLPERIVANRVDAQGVILRLPGPTRPYTPPELMFLLWVADEKFAGWKLLGFELPPTN